MYTSMGLEPPAHSLPEAHQQGPPTDTRLEIQQQQQADLAVTAATAEQFTAISVAVEQERGLAEPGHDADLYGGFECNY